MTDFIPSDAFLVNREEMRDELLRVAGDAINDHYGGIPGQLDWVVAAALVPVVNRRLVEAWDEGYGSGEGDTRIVTGSYTRNPYHQEEK